MHIECFWYDVLYRTYLVTLTVRQKFNQEKFFIILMHHAPFVLTQAYRTVPRSGSSNLVIRYPQSSQLKPIERVKVFPLF